MQINMEKYLLYISIIANIVLVVLLFLKSAINKILEEWWKEKQAKRNEKLSYLNLLKVIMDKLRRYYTIFFIENYRQLNESEYIQSTSAHIKSNEMAEKIGQCLQEISIAEMHYPSDIRQGVRDFVNKYSKRTENFINNPRKELLKTIVDEIETDCSNIIQSIEKIIFK